MSAIGSVAWLAARRARLLQPRRVWTAVAKRDLVLALRAGLVTSAEVDAAHGLDAATLDAFAATRRHPARAA